MRTRSYLARRLNPIRSILNKVTTTVQTTKNNIHQSILKYKVDRTFQMLGRQTVEYLNLKHDPDLYTVPLLDILLLYYQQHQLNLEDIPDTISIEHFNPDTGETTSVCKIPTESMYAVFDLSPITDSEITDDDPTSPPKADIPVILGYATAVRTIANPKPTIHGSKPIATLYTNTDTGQCSTPDTPINLHKQILSAIGEFARNKSYPIIPGDEAIYAEGRSRVA